MNVAWLVDMGYLPKTATFQVDYLLAKGVLARHLRATSVGLFLFNGIDTSYNNGAQKAFYEKMRANGIVVRLHPMRLGKQRRVDVDIGAHLIWQASLPDVETIVLTTGDEDMIPAVEMAQQQFKKQVVLLTFPTNVHTELSALANDHRQFDDFAHRLLRH